MEELLLVLFVDILEVLNELHGVLKLQTSIFNLTLSLVHSWKATNTLAVSSKSLITHCLVLALDLKLILLVAAEFSPNLSVHILVNGLLVKISRPRHVVSTARGCLNGNLR